MTALHLAEIRGSWRAWLSVSLPFVAASLALSLGVLVLTAAAQAEAAGRYDAQSRMGVQAIVGMNLALAVLVGIGVLSASAQLVVNSRRPAIARLALAGATPAQIRNLLASQLLVVSLVCGLAGNLLALLVQAPVLHHVGGAGDGMDPEAMRAVLPVGPLLMATLAVIVISLLAGIPVAARATGIPPIEALRQGPAEPDQRVPKATKVIFGLFVAAIVAVSAISYHAFTLNPYQKGDQIVMIGLLVLVLSGLAMQRGAGLLMRPLTRAWTALVPTSSPAWQLARQTVLARSVRLARTVVPVMFAVGLGTGMITIFAILNRLFGLLEGGSGEADTLAGIVLLVGLAFGIALAGAVGNLLMMGRQRDAELALAGLSGATEGQRRAMVGFEGLIIGGTAVILGLIMAGYSVAYVVIGLAIFVQPVFAVDLVEVVIVIAGALALCVIATMAPALPTLRQPPQQVVARLIAD